jgi:hypothetical protein
VPNTETSVAGRQQAGTLDWAATVLAAGSLAPHQPLSSDPYSISAGIGSATYHKDDALTRAIVSNITAGLPLVISGDEASAMFITFDFTMPKHGYPVVEFAGGTRENVIVDFGYTEKAFDLYTGDAFVTEDGWLNAEGIVGKGYADRYVTAADDQRVELPDERTARWMTLNIHFIEAGDVVLANVGMQTWMYPAAIATEPTGSFECGDSVMDSIVQLSLTHALISMSDTYV